MKWWLSKKKHLGEAEKSPLLFGALQSDHTSRLINLLRHFIWTWTTISLHLICFCILPLNNSKWVNSFWVILSSAFSSYHISHSCIFLTYSMWIRTYTNTYIRPGSAKLCDSVSFWGRSQRTQKKNAFATQLNECRNEGCDGRQDDNQPRTT